jgi:hypothetical protein
MEPRSKIFPPVLSVYAVFGEYRFAFEEDSQALEVFVDAIEHDDVGRDHQEVARETRCGLVKLVEEAPGQGEVSGSNFPAALSPATILIAA